MANGPAALQSGNLIYAVARDHPPAIPAFKPPEESEATVYYHPDQPERSVVLRGTSPVWPWVIGIFGGIGGDVPRAQELRVVAPYRPPRHPPP